MNKVQTVRPKEQIVDHSKMSTRYIEMSLESPLFHFNQFEELEYEKQVVKVVHVHEARNLDDDLDTHTTHEESVESYCEDECDNDELLLQEKFEDEFSKFCEKTSVEE